jgi:hypothetical protein
MHYVPEYGVYVYFRYDKSQTVMCVMNTSKEKRTIDFSKYSERINGFARAKNILTDEEMSATGSFPINATEMFVLELLK